MINEETFQLINDAAKYWGVVATGNTDKESFFYEFKDEETAGCFSRQIKNSYYGNNLRIINGGETIFVSSY